MLKLRVTFIDNEKGKLELEEMIGTLSNNYNVINISKTYKGRNKSLYSNVYIDVETKEKYIVSEDYIND